MSIRAGETASIRTFLHCHLDKLTGTVLDLGCGKQPYRAIIEQAGGEYFGWDRSDLPGSVVPDDVGLDGDVELVGEYDTIVMTQVWQYVPLRELTLDLSLFASGDSLLQRGGWLLATGAWKLSL